jgi:FtsZ-binding cell division protein ZapB
MQSIETLRILQMHVSIVDDKTKEKRNRGGEREREKRERERERERERKGLKRSRNQMPKIPNAPNSQNLLKIGY